MNTNISVIIPAHNYGRFIADAIKSAFNQTTRPYEVLVVDDGSLDNTASIVRGFGDAVRYIWQENAGVCAARNRGVAETSGELIAFLDADDIWANNKLEEQASVFLSDPEIGLVHCSILDFEDRTGEKIGVPSAGMSGWVADELLLWERQAVNVSGSAVMVSRSAFEAVGGFDERLKVAEDWDFCYRVARQFKVGFVPEPLVNYRIHGSAAHRNIAEMERGMRMFYEKAFADGGDVLSLRDRSYGNFHRIIAGSYFQAREYRKALEHGMLSLWFRPAGLLYLLGFAYRRLSGNNR